MSPDSVACQQNLVQTVITADAQNIGGNGIGFDFTDLGFTVGSVTIAGSGNATQTEFNLIGSGSTQPGSAYDNLINNPAFQANFVAAGFDPTHPGYTFANWRQNVGNYSMQITVSSTGDIQVDIDPNNPMINPIAHAWDVFFDTMTGRDTNYNSVATNLGISATPCQ
jgi:hypothetical protein